MKWYRQRVCFTGKVTGAGKKVLQASRGQARADVSN
jgi:hypothetical protein